MVFLSKINTASDFLKKNSWFTNKFLINFGYIEDSPGNDLNFCNSPMISLVPKSNPSVKEYFKPISNQYSISSCVANSVADSFEAMIIKKTECPPLAVEDLSRYIL